MSGSTASRIGWMAASVAGVVMIVAWGGLAIADEVKGDAYTLGVCAGCGGRLGSSMEPVSHSHEGRDLKFCCSECIRMFEKDPGKKTAKLDEAIVKQQLPYYPLDTCIVSGEKLGSMGDPVDYVYNNRLVRFCCAGCMSSFNKEPEKYLAELDKAAIGKQKAAYPLDTCVVSGEKLGTMGEPVDLVAGNRLVRLCCEGCVSTFQKNPTKYMKMIDEAAAGAAPGSSSPSSSGGGSGHKMSHDQHGGHSHSSQ